MESFLIYIFKASALLGIFYLSYLLLLKKETSFELNRKFLLSGLFTSLILPLISLTKKIYIEATPETFSYISTSANITEIPVENSLDWWHISGIIYLIITGFFLTRFCIQISAVIKIILVNKVQKRSAFRYLEVADDQLPFSFFNYIVFNPYKHSEKDLKFILEHEKVHARQLHSADIILVNLINCFFWFNPFSWFYKKAVEQNLEFIADRETVSRTKEIKEYQHALVKVSIADLRPALTNHFYQSFIKKRILMLNKKSSSQSQAWKLSLVMPLILAFMLLFNVKTEAQVVEKEKLTFTEKTTVPESEEKAEVPEAVKINEEIKTPEVIQVEITEAPELVWNQTNGHETANNLTEIGLNPLYIINGKRYEASKLKNRYVGLRSRLQVLGSEEARDRYGEDAENGAIIIPDAEIIRNFNKELDAIEGRDFSGRYMMVGDNGQPNFIDLNSSSTAPKAKRIFIKNTNEDTGRKYRFEANHVRVEGTSSAPNAEKSITIEGFKSGSIKEAEKTIYIKPKKPEQKSDPLYIIDGEEKAVSFEVNSINPIEIRSVNVLKGEAAIEKYGKKASNGAIQIFTKASGYKKKDLEDPKFIIIPGSTDDNKLKSIAIELERDLDWKINFSEIQRNKEGEITQISISANKDGKSSNASLKDSSGISRIIIGLSKDGEIIISNTPEKEQFK